MTTAKTATRNALDSILASSRAEIRRKISEIAGGGPSAVSLVVEFNSSLADAVAHRYDVDFTAFLKTNKYSIFNAARRQMQAARILLFHLLRSSPVVVLDNNGADIHSFEANIIFAMIACLRQFDVTLGKLDGHLLTSMNSYAANVAAHTGYSGPENKQIIRLILDQVPQKLAIRRIKAKLDKSFQ